MGDFSGKVVIVTGGAKGIGRAISLSFARAGASVACADIDEAAGAEMGELAADAEGKLLFVNADVSKADQCQTLVERTVREFGGVDILCNNVGIQPTDSYKPAHELPEEMWDRIINVN
ncbi:MAG: SDR family NAD(P)-dependent oxidoreductase, partial [Caldilineaceae bacterium]|nr:SDR family NAD(P)-dependent oxidoreductase [Caldilineaceae bacterium]